MTHRKVFKNNREVSIFKHYRPYPYLQLMAKSDFSTFPLFSHLHYLVFFVGGGGIVFINLSTIRICS